MRCQEKIFGGGTGGLVVGEQGEAEVLRKGRDALRVGSGGFKLELERTREICAARETVHPERTGKLVRGRQSLIVKTRAISSEFEEHQAFHDLWLIAIPQVIQQFLSGHLLGLGEEASRDTLAGGRGVLCLL